MSYKWLPQKKFFFLAKGMCKTCFSPYLIATPSPQVGEEIPTNRRTNRRTNSSAKQAPSALDLSPRPKHTFLMVAKYLQSCGNPKEASIFEEKKNLVEVVRSKLGRRIYGETPHTPPQSWGFCGPIRVPSPKGFNCWFNPL